MQARIKIPYGPLLYFINYLQNCIEQKPHTVDYVKEYLLASNIRQVIFKLQQLNLKYEQIFLARIPIKEKKITVTDCEVLSLNIYFTRYQVPNYLLPIEHDILKTLQSSPLNQLTNILTKINI